ncbi:hypothetical protein ACVWYQ_003274 [Bradyrhizobium sp. USDA 3397]
MRWMTLRSLALKGDVGLVVNMRCCQKAHTQCLEAVKLSPNPPLDRYPLELFRCIGVAQILQRSLRRGDRIGGAVES